MAHGGNLKEHLGSRKSHFRRIHACENIMQLVAGNEFQTFVTIFPGEEDEGTERNGRNKLEVVYQ